MKQKMMKTIDIHFNGLKDRVKQKQFGIIWEPGTQNVADYFIKFPSGTHYQHLRPLYLFEKDSPTTMKGCIRLLKNTQKRQRIGSSSLVSSIPISCPLRPLILY